MRTALPLAVTRAMFRTVVSTGAVPVTWVTPQADIHRAPSAAFELLLQDKPEACVLLPEGRAETLSDSDEQPATASSSSEQSNCCRVREFKAFPLKLSC